EMLEIVNSFVEGVAGIARGSVEIAANFLEGALGRGVPVAIGFLANQVGLSGIGRRIGEMIERVRALVDRALDWLIDKAVRLGTSFLRSLGVGSGEEESEEGGVEAGHDWRDEEGVFHEEGHQHKVTFNGSNILVASEDPIRLEDLKNEREQRSGPLNDEQLASFNAAVGLKPELETLTDEFSQAQMNNDAAQMSEKERLIREKLQTMANHLQDADLFLGRAPLDPTHVTFAPVSGKAGTVTAEPLTRVPGNTQGEAQSGGGPDLQGWEYVHNVNSMSYILDSQGKPMTTSTGRLRLSKPYKKVHVLSHHLHGPLRYWNLTPGEQVMNSAFLSAFEQTLKDETSADKTYSLSVTLNYYSNQNRVKSIIQGSRTLSAQDSDFAETATVTFGEKNAQTGNYGTQTITVDGTPLPNVEGASLDFTVRHLKSAIDRNVDSWSDRSQVKIWSAYRRDHINRDLQLRLGDTILSELHQHYLQKIGQKFGD
ncbi:MAG: hypothetical protein OES26_27235, partial [Gammaproteobacteria bacterium]|nr:hypothetical protein [Gammaproteobacteria bacterium]